jgi:hypothetical protein
MLPGDPTSLLYMIHVHGSVVRPPLSCAHVCGGLEFAGSVLVVRFAPNFTGAPLDE